MSTYPNNISLLRWLSDPIWGASLAIWLDLASNSSSRDNMDTAAGMAVSLFPLTTRTCQNTKRKGTVHQQVNYPNDKGDG